MKTIIISLSFLFILLNSACTKKYSCKCTTTISEQGYYPKETVTVEEITSKGTKKKSQQICDNTAKQLSANSREYWSSSVEVSAKCELKDY